jgi:hypothetical protein
VRATLGAVSERLAFRDFEQTAIDYIAGVLDAPDEELVSFQVLGPERLDAFAQRFAADPTAVFRECFGTEEIERRPELAEIPDIRLTNLDVDAEESDTAVEIDANVPTAPGEGVALPATLDQDDDITLVVEYLLEYTSRHLSPVIARGLRVYRERGLAAVTTEFRVTKAPRKTLSAVIDLARTRFDKVAIIYDGFDSWASMDDELRQSIAATMTELRWKLDGRAVLVMLLEEGEVPELEETFSAAVHLRWDFRWLIPLQQEPDALNTEMLDEWLSSAALPASEPMTMADPVLAKLAVTSDGSLSKFAVMAFDAFEDAAERGVSALDEVAFAAALAAEDSK